jgi:endonuclease/exonuclease/phosphatase family metal-dependent hydrolase
VHFSAFSSTDRRIQADIALPWITSTPGQKIWAGDFNIDAYGSDTTDQGIYADITSFFNDSYTVALSRIGNETWPSTAPVERIDYIFVTPTMSVLSHAVPSSLASDHLPVAVQIQLPLALHKCEAIFFRNCIHEGTNLFNLQGGILTELKNRDFEY